ncbi:glycosyl transferase [Bacteroidia bacterium]|nr:glycosyl transferase [Bacteroidia bacterium]
MMKEVCIVNYISNAAIYGIGTYIKEYVYCLENIGCKINLIELGTDDSNPDFYIREERNVRKIHIPYLREGAIAKYNKGVCRLLRLYIEDSENLVFHFQYAYSDSLLDNIKNYFPLSKSVFTIHYLSWSEVLQGDRLLFEKIIRKQEAEEIKKKYQIVIDNYHREKLFMEKVDHIVCLSDDTLNLVQNLYHIKQKLWFIPNGLRGKNRNLSEKQKADLRKKYYISNNEKVLLFVGRIHPIKGIYSLLSCFDDVIKNYQDCRLVVIGDGNINEAIKKCRKAWSKIIFTGRLDKKTLYQWYQIADVALFPSFYEECSYVGIEMMMHGLPVVASDGYSIRNMFQDNLNTKVIKIENRKKISKFENNLKESILEILASDLSDIRKESKKNIQIKIQY